MSKYEFTDTKQAMRGALEILCLFVANHETEETARNFAVLTLESVRSDENLTTAYLTDALQQLVYDYRNLERYRLKSILGR